VLIPFLHCSNAIGIVACFLGCGSVLNIKIVNSNRLSLVNNAENSVIIMEQIDEITALNNGIQYVATGRHQVAAPTLLTKITTFMHHHNDTIMPILYGSIIVCTLASIIIMHSDHMKALDALNSNLVHISALLAAHHK
jgi:hypothetical protein